MKNLLEENAAEIATRRQQIEREREIQKMSQLDGEHEEFEKIRVQDKEDKWD